MTVLDCLKPLTLSAIGNDHRMLRNKFVVVCKCPGGQHTLNCQMPAPGTHREINARGLPGGGVLTDGIDSHVSLRTKKHVTGNTYIFCWALDISKIRYI